MQNGQWKMKEEHCERLAPVSVLALGHLGFYRLRLEWRKWT
jgi:hypothetical protein